MQRTALVVGSGPNGLAAAIVLAQAGVNVTVYEAAPVAGGATRSGELTLPGFIHDLGSAVHPMAVTSPFFSSLPLKDHGLKWIHPIAQLAHPLSEGPAILVERSVDSTATQFGKDDGAYRTLYEPLVSHWATLSKDLLRPLGLPRHPLQFSNFGRHAYLSAESLAKKLFSTANASALFAGLAAHSTLPLDAAFSASFGLVLGASAHAVGWPIAAGGSQSIADALQGVLKSLGGKVVTGHRVDKLSQHSGADVTLCDVTPRQFLELSDGRLQPAFQAKLEAYRYGPGVFKVDWALREPIPWRSKECLRSATVHVGGSYEEIALSEALVSEGKVAPNPFVLLAQPSLFDTRRTPHGGHTVWAYCHVPNGYRGSALPNIQAQIERFAPGFRDCVIACASYSAANMQGWNENLVGGDINGGAVDYKQLFLRPTSMRYKTSLPGVFLCSSSTPPGGAVHGMCGYWAAQWALGYLRRKR
jgi:phytoene dehydrogenase-like protein